MSDAVFETHLASLPRIAQGKVRDLYAIGDTELLMVATDRLSAFDVILPTPIPGKGQMLTAISNFWFDFLGSTVSNHCTDRDLTDLPLTDQERTMLQGRSMRVRRLQPLPVEAVVRGYLTGSGWQDYQRTGQVCGLSLPGELKLASRLSSPLFTPATKADAGDHDENIGFDQVVALIGEDRACEMRDISVRLYQQACAHALKQGVIIADTKFEFGLDDSGRLTLMDEVLTPDSSRFWEAQHWCEGVPPESFDKQIVRDWLETQEWDKCAPGPELPAEVIHRTAERYRLIGRRLCGDSFTEF